MLRARTDRLVSWDDCAGKPPAGKILVKDAITDAFLQQILTRPDEFDVIPCCNLTGDLISDDHSLEERPMGGEGDCDLRAIDGTREARSPPPAGVGRQRYRKAGGGRK